MITTASDDRITFVTLDRPARRNALTIDGLDALERAIDEATDPVVYLSGEGSAFCAGADFDVISGLDDQEAAAAFAERGQSVADAMERSDAIVVAGIDGPARGGGVELALAADLRVATPRATLAETGVDIGLFGAWGGTVRLPEVVGLGHALDLALSGRTLTAEEALDIGLVTRITPRPQTVARSLAAKPARSLRTIKHRLRDRDPADERFARERSAFAELVAAGPALPD